MFGELWSPWEECYFSLSYLEEGGAQSFPKKFDERFSYVRLRHYPYTDNNNPRSIYQNSNMTPRLSGQNCKIFKIPLSLDAQDCAQGGGVQSFGGTLHPKRNVT